MLGGALARNPPRWLDDSPSGPGDTPLRASTSTARTGNLHLPDHLLSAVNESVARRSRRTAVEAGLARHGAEPGPAAGAGDPSRGAAAPAPGRPVEHAHRRFG